MGNEEVWPGVSRLDLFEKLEIPRGSKRRVKERLKPYVKDQYACDLIDKLLSLDPSKRLDADNALNHSLQPGGTREQEGRCSQCQPSSSPGSLHTTRDTWTESSRTRLLGEILNAGFHCIQILKRVW